MLMIKPMRPLVPVASTLAIAVNRRPYSTSITVTLEWDGITEWTKCFNVVDSGYEKRRTES